MRVHRCINALLNTRAAPETPDLGSESTGQQLLVLPGHKTNAPLSSCAVMLGIVVSSSPLCRKRGGKVRITPIV